jgi:uncharacterized protein YqgV (UPF0045/DUF77 family)
MTTTLLSVQIIPLEANREISIPLIDEAIEVIKSSGLTYRVGPLDTVVEGEWKSVQNLLTSMNERVLSLGAMQCLFQIKLLHRPAGITITELTDKHEHTKN